MMRGDADPPRSPGWLRSPYTTAAWVALAVFLVVTLLFELRLLAGLDAAVRAGRGEIASPLLRWWSTGAFLLGLPISALFFSGIAAVLLGRQGLGWWSLAPLAFLAPTLLEMGFKLLFHPSETAVSIQLTRRLLPVIELPGSYPSGHAIRAAFLCAFLAVLLLHRGGRWERWWAAILGVLAVLIGFGRVYGGQHLLSEVVAGLLLGAATALLAAPPVARRLFGRGRGEGLEPPIPARRE